MLTLLVPGVGMGASGATSTHDAKVFYVVDRDTSFQVPDRDAEFQVLDRPTSFQVDA